MCGDWRWPLMTSVTDRSTVDLRRDDGEKHWRGPSRLSVRGITKCYGRTVTSGVVLRSPIGIEGIGCCLTSLRVAQDGPWVGGYRPFDLVIVCSVRFTSYPCLKKKWHEKRYHRREKRRKIKREEKLKKLILYKNSFRLFVWYFKCLKIHMLNYWKLSNVDTLVVGLGLIWYKWWNL